MIKRMEVSKPPSAFIDNCPPSTDEVSKELQRSMRNLNLKVRPDYCTKTRVTSGNPFTGVRPLKAPSSAAIIILSGVSAKPPLHRLLFNLALLFFSIPKGKGQIH